jgi:hypothetical protein
MVSITEDRRRHPRTKLDHIVYMHLNSGNGAIVLDVSQRGLGFHAATPIDTQEFGRLRLSGKSIDNIEIACELAWNDQTKKSGGLRFIGIPDEFRERVQLLVGHVPVPTANSSQTESVNATSTPYIAAKVTTGSDNGTKSAGQNQLVSTAMLVRPSSWSRARILVSIALAAIALNCLTLFLVRRLAQARVNDEAVTETNDSLLESQAALGQTETILRHKANLLSIVVSITPPGDSALQESIDDELTNDGSDLIAITNSANRIIALHTTDRSMTFTTGEEMLVGSLSRGSDADWWFANGKVYQIVLQSLDHSPLSNNNSGFVIVGRQIGDKTVQQLKALSQSDVAIDYDGEIIESTLRHSDRLAISAKTEKRVGVGEFQIGEQKFYVNSVNLSNRSSPALRYMVLKSVEAQPPFLQRVNHLVVRVVGIESFALLTFAIFAASKRAPKLPSVDSKP